MLKKDPEHPLTGEKGDVMTQKEYEYILPIRLNGMVTDREEMNAFCFKGLPASPQDPFQLVSWDESLNRALKEIHQTDMASAHKYHAKPPVIPEITQAELTFYGQFQEPNQGTLRIKTDSQLTHREEALLAQSVDQSLNLASLYLAGRPFLSEDFHGMQGVGNTFVMADMAEHRFTYEIGFQSVKQWPVGNVSEVNRQLYDKLHPDGDSFHSTQMDNLIERLRQDPAGNVNPEILNVHLSFTDDTHGMIQIQTDAPVENTTPLEMWSFSCMNQMLNQDPYFSDQLLTFQLTDEGMRLHPIKADDRQQENPLQLTDADLEGLVAEEQIEL